MRDKLPARIAQLLASNKRRQRYLIAFAVVALGVVLNVALMLRQSGVAMTHEEQVLDCQFSGEAAHTHDASCYDEDGNLVCPLPERPLHTHTEECYEHEQTLVCGLEEGEGAHHHTDECYDEEGNLVCGLEESEGHQHTDACYETVRVGDPICGLEELTEEHVHGPGCFQTITVQDTTPAFSHREELKERDAETGAERVWLTVSIEAPEDAFDDDSIHVKIEAQDAEAVRAAVEAELAAERSRTGAAEEAAQIAAMRAVRIQFLDAEGKQVAPAKPVLVQLKGEVANDADQIQRITEQGKGATLEPLTTKQLAAKGKSAAAQNEQYVELSEKDNRVVLITTQARADELSPATASEEEPVAVPEEEQQAEGLTTEDGSPTPEQSLTGAAGSISVAVSAPAGALPEGVQMVVTPVASSEVAGAVQDAVDGYVSQVAAVDISFYDADGNEVQPALPVRVTMTNTDAPTAGEPVVVHVADSGEADVVDQTMVTSSNEDVVFSADSFSKYAVVYTVLSQTIKAGDGHAYNVEVTYGPESGIPKGATLDVRELVEGTSEYSEYLADAQAATGETLEYARFFDITIKDGETEIQPSSAVQVAITLVDSHDLTSSVQALHFADDGVEALDVSVEDATVSFEAEGFSVYAIVDKEEDTSTARARIVFENVDGTAYQFLNNAGNTVSEQIIHTDSVLEEVGIPAIDVNGQTFQGWYIYDKTADRFTSYQLKFGGTNTWIVSYGDAQSITSSAAVVTSENADDEGATFYARPYFGEVSYLTFYNESAGDNEGLGGHGIILNRVQVIKDTEYDISLQQATPPDSVWNESTQEWEPVSYVFAGWHKAAGEDGDNRTAITDTKITVTGNMSFYPIFKQGHWVTFFSAPSGSGADYVPAKIVLSNQTTSVAKPATSPSWTGHTFVGWFTEPETYDPKNSTNADGTINPTYNGYFSTNENASSAYRFNERLEDDLTLYAHWNVGMANVTVVKWQQVVTDDKNATTPTRDQMAEDGYASNTSLKHYEYAGQQNLDKTVNSILLSSDNAITVPIGFGLNSTLSDAQVVVKDDGTAVLNLYFDRKLITMNFDKDIETYTEAIESTGTLYGLVDGQYVQINSDGSYSATIQHAGTRYRVAQNSTSGTKYGIVDGRLVQLTDNGGWSSYLWQYRGSNNTWVTYSGTMYVETTSNENTQYAFIDGQMCQLTRSGTQGNRTWSYTVSATYSGTLYTRNATRSFTGLYGQTLTQNGYKWPEGNWSYYDGGSKMGMSYLGQFVLPISGDTINFSSSGSDYKVVYFYLQNVDGTYSDTPSDTGYLSNQNGTFYFSEKYDGFTVKQYRLNNGSWQTASNNGSTTFYSNNTLHIRYERLKYTVKFLDSHDGSVLSDVKSQQVVYGASLSSVEPGENTTVTNANTQYVWDGKWYADQECTVEFDFSQTMPNHDVAVYAGWNEVWYWIKIDPNGGVLSDTESTWFWESYGGIVEEYHNITRGYVEDPSGEYYYHIDVLDPETEKNQYGTNVRKAEYRLISENPSWQEDSFDGLRYSVDTNRTYSLVGWYKVNDDGTLEPYNFSSPVASNLTLRALWRVVGEYHVKYSLEGVDAEGNELYAKDAEGNPTQDRLQGANAPSDTNKYADKSSSSILQSAEPPAGYTFVGWYYNHHVYNPGDTFIVDADLADENKDVWIYPVYLAIEDQPVETTHIPFVGNGGTTEMTSGSNDDWAWEVSAGKDKIDYVNVQPNKSFDLSESPNYFTRPGYTFVGWGKRSEGESTTANNFLEYRDGRFYLTGTETEASAIAADEITPYEELYALWEAKTYTVTVVKEVSSQLDDDMNTPFAFTPSFQGVSGTEYQTNFSLVGNERGASQTSTDENGNATLVEYAHSKTYENVPYGATFSITEGDYPFEVSVAYSVSDADEDGKNVQNQSSSNGAELTVEGNVTVTFTNTRKSVSVDIAKYSADDAPLSGSTFKLTRNDGSSWALIYDSFRLGDATTNFTTVDLPSGYTYRLEEVTAPDGYIITNAITEFEVANDGTVTLTTGDEINTGTVINSNGQEVRLAEIGTPLAEGSKASVNVRNQPGTALPRTGGAGTLLYTLSGAAIMAAAGYYGFASRRKRERGSV